MPPEEIALPTGGNAEASAQADSSAAAADNTEASTAATGAEEGHPNEKHADQTEKKEKTPEQREIERLRRRLDNKTRQVYELRAQTEQRGGQPQPNTQQAAADDEPVTLTRAELQRQIEEQAQRLAPTISEQRAEGQRRQGIVESLAKEWGQEKFDDIAAELDDAFGGLADRSGKPKPATDAIFESDDPKGVIEYLTAHPDEAEKLSSMHASRAGREVARIEAKLESDKVASKAKPSKAPAPIESARGGGVPNGMPDPSNTKAYIAWANAQERAKR